MFDLMRTIKRVMSFLHLLYSLPALVERLSSFQIDELDEEKTKVIRIRSETKFHEMRDIFTCFRPNFANRLACFGTAKRYPWVRIEV